MPRSEHVVFIKHELQLRLGENCKAMEGGQLQSFAIVSCFFIGLSLGLLGSGGSILTVPILVYLLEIDAKEAIAMSLVVVGVTSGFALISHALSGNVNWKIGSIFGLAGMSGAFLGGILAGYISERILMILFAVMTLATATAMLCRDSNSEPRISGSSRSETYWPVPHESEEEANGRSDFAPDDLDVQSSGLQPVSVQANSDGLQPTCEAQNADASNFKLDEPKDEAKLSNLKLPIWRIVLDGFLVGVVTGMVGAGGGFLVVPALVFFGGLQMTEAIGTSLLVISTKCAAGYLGHAQHVQIDLKLTVLVSFSAVLGSLVGGFGAERIPQAALRKAFAVFVLLIGTLQLFKESMDPK